ncbi:MAG: hypothetical protein ACI4PF_00940 [Christensenellales bacterium]
MKKFLSFLFALLVLVPCSYFMTACKNNDTEKVMNVELNPKLEFVLDKNDKVVSVNALNDDGNHIISISIESETLFEGLTAEEALELFLQIAKDNGYLITGNEEEITISISGSAKELLNSVKSVAKDYLDKNGININVVTEALKKSELVSKVKECMQEYTEVELNNMTEEELINLIKQSRKETRDFLTQELKEVYYALRLEELNTAKFQALLDALNISGGVGEAMNGFTSNMENLLTSLEQLKNALVEQLLAEDSEYNIKMQAYIEVKTELLEARLELSADGTITADEKAILDDIETRVNEAKVALENAKQTALEALTALRTQVNNTLAQVEPFLNSVKNWLNGIGANLDNYENAKDNAKKNFAEEFKADTKFAGFVGKDNSHWAKNLKPAE